MEYYIQTVGTWVLGEYEYAVYSREDVLLTKFESEADAEEYIASGLAAATNKIKSKGDRKMNTAKYTLNDIMTISEAAELYNMNVNTIKSKLKPSVVGKEKIEGWVAEGLVRQSGSTWLLTKEFMLRNFKKLQVAGKGE